MRSRGGVGASKERSSVRGISSNSTRTRHKNYSPMALFRCKKFLDFATVALSFVYDKYCPIID